MSEGMAVRVFEYGNRPAVLTRARRFAPEAARAIGEIMGQKRVGDLGIVVVDWCNQLGQQPSDIAKPILHLQVIKDYGDTGQSLMVESRIDVDEVFGAPDFIDRSLLADLVQELYEKIASEEARKGNEWTRPYSRT